MEPEEIRRGMELRFRRAAREEGAACRIIRHRSDQERLGRGFPLRQRPQQQKPFLDGYRCIHVLIKYEIDITSLAPASAGASDVFVLGAPVYSPGANITMRFQSLVR